jgi:[ribosomal protein S18]-alanine N-acetyltransferase
MEDRVSSENRAGAEAAENTTPTFGAGEKTYFVQSLRVDDLAQVCSIENAIYPFPWSVGNFKDSLVSGYDAWVVRVPQAIGVVAYAVVMWIPDDAHLLNISVALSHQHKGIGTAFLAWITVNARSRNAKNMMLEVRPSNYAALRLYTKAGFTQIGKRKGYYPNGMNQREDALVLNKRLSN